MKTDIIIPVGHIEGLNDIRERTRSLLFSIRTFYQRHPADVSLVVVCQNVPTMAAQLTAAGVRVVQVTSPVFNKSWCINVGARLTSGDIIIIAESDMWAERPYLHQIGPWMDGLNIPWCIAWETLFYTMQQQKYQIISTRAGVKCSAANTTAPRPNYSEGGFVAFRRSFFSLIGGCNEWMQELGGIDNDLALRARLKSGYYKAYPMRVYHLWHPQVRQRTRPSRIKNVEILNYTKKHTTKMINILFKQQAGDPRTPYCSRVSWAGEIRKYP